MVEERGRTRCVWPVIVILAVVIIGFSFIFMAAVDLVLDVLLENAGLSWTLESLDEGAVATLRFMTVRPVLNEIWFGIFGLFCAWGIKRKVRFAWKFGLLWGLMLIVIGIINAVYELFILGWSETCLQAPEFIIVGVIALGCLLLVEKEFVQTSDRVHVKG